MNNLLIYNKSYIENEFEDELIITKKNIEEMKEIINNKNTLINYYNIHLLIYLFIYIVISSILHNNIAYLIIANSYLNNDLTIETYNNISSISNNTELNNNSNVIYLNTTSLNYYQFKDFNNKNFNVLTIIKLIYIGQLIGISMSYYISFLFTNNNYFNFNELNYIKFVFPKKIIVISLFFISLINMMFCFNNNSYAMFCTCILLANIFYNVILSNSHLLVNEMLSNKYNNNNYIITSILIMSYYLSVIYVLNFDIIKNINFKFVVNVLLVIVLCFITNHYTIESINFLYNRKLYVNLIHQIKKVAIFNNTKNKLNKYLITILPVELSALHLIKDNNIRKVNDDEDYNIVTKDKSIDDFLEFHNRKNTIDSKYNNEYNSVNKKVLLLNNISYNDDNNNNNNNNNNNSVNDNINKKILNKKKTNFVDSKNKDILKTNSFDYYYPYNYNNSNILKSVSLVFSSFYKVIAAILSCLKYNNCRKLLVITTLYYFLCSYIYLWFISIVVLNNVVYNNLILLCLIQIIIIAVYVNIHINILMFLELKTFISCVLIFILFVFMLINIINDYSSILFVLIAVLLLAINIFYVTCSFFINNNINIYKINYKQNLNIMHLSKILNITVVYILSNTLLKESNILYITIIISIAIFLLIVLFKTVL